MSFLTRDDSKINDMEKSKGGNIYTSGIYEIEIERVEAKKTPNGAKVLDIAYVMGNGAKGYLFGLKLTNNDGSENFQRALVDALMAIVGLKTVSNPVKMKINTAKGEKEVHVLKEFSGKKVKVFVVAEYTKWQNKIYKNLNIQNFYRASDNASAKEILTGSDVGTRFEIESKYANEVVYSQGVTEEEAKAWEEANKPNKGTSTGNINKEIELKDDDSEIPF